MVVATLGQPERIEERVTKTKTTDLPKYGLMNQRKCRLKVRPENGSVVGWDGKVNELPAAAATSIRKVPGA